MKTECAYTRGKLERYLGGFLFLPQQRRIERHLAGCPVCSSELDAARRTEETRRILQEVESPGRSAALARSASGALRAVRRLLYRPLWLGLILAAAAATYLSLIMPLLYDPDLERLDAAVRSAVTAEGAPPAPAPPPPAPQAKPARKADPPPLEQKPAADPLIVTITVEQERERASIEEINDAMEGHPMLRTMQFSDAVREISGSLTAEELTIFFSRIQGNGRISYRRARLAGVGAGELVPFVVRVRTAAPRPPAPQPAAGASREASDEKPVERPVEKQAEKPVERPADRPVGRSAPASAE